jgi:hypothetical protein
VEVVGEENDMTYAQGQLEQNSAQNVLDWDNIWEDETCNEDDLPLECEHPINPLPVAPTYHAGYQPEVQSSHRQFVSFPCATSSSMQQMSNFVDHEWQVMMPLNGQSWFRDAAEVQNVAGSHWAQPPLHRPSFEVSFEADNTYNRNVESNIQTQQRMLSQDVSYPMRPLDYSVEGIGVPIPNASVGHHDLQQPRSRFQSLARPGHFRNRRQRLFAAFTAEVMNRSHEYPRLGSDGATVPAFSERSDEQAQWYPPQEQTNMPLNIPRLTSRRRFRARNANRTMQEGWVPQHNRRARVFERPDNRREFGAGYGNANRPANPPIYIPEDERPSFSPLPEGTGTIYDDTISESGQGFDRSVMSFEPQSPQVVKAILSYMPVEELAEKNPKEDLCVICREPMCAGEEVRRLPCFHVFHAACIDQWLEVKMTCPLDNCRVDEMIRAMTCSCEHCLSGGRAISME